MKYAGAEAMQQMKDSAQEKMDKVVLASAAAMEKMNNDMEDIKGRVSSLLSYDAEAEALTFGSTKTASEEGNNA